MLLLWRSHLEGIYCVTLTVETKFDTAAYLVSQREAGLPLMRKTKLLRKLT